MPTRQPAAKGPFADHRAHGLFTEAPVHACQRARVAALIANDRGGPALLGHQFPTRHHPVLSARRLGVAGLGGPGTWLGGRRRQRRPPSPSVRNQPFTLGPGASPEVLKGLPFSGLPPRSARGGLVLFNDACRDAPASADRDASMLCPRSDLAVASRGCPPRAAAARSSPTPAGVFDERCEFLAERRGVSCVQIDLVDGAAHAEPHRLICWASVQIVFQYDAYLLCHSGLLTAIAFCSGTRATA